MANLSKVRAGRARGIQGNGEFYTKRVPVSSSGFRTLTRHIGRHGSRPSSRFAGLGRPLREQVRPPLPRPLEGAGPPPALDPAWSPDRRTSGTASAPELPRPRVVRIVEPLPQEGLALQRLRRADDSRDQPRDGLGQGQRRRLAAGQDEVAEGDLLVEEAESRTRSSIPS